MQRLQTLEGIRSDDSFEHIHLEEKLLYLRVNLQISHLRESLPSKVQFLIELGVSAEILPFDTRADRFFRHHRRCLLRGEQCH